MAAVGVTVCLFRATMVMKALYQHAFTQGPRRTVWIVKCSDNPSIDNPGFTVCIYTISVCIVLAYIQSIKLHKFNV